MLRRALPLLTAACTHTMMGDGKDRRAQAVPWQRMHQCVRMCHRFGGKGSREIGRSFGREVGNQDPTPRSRRLACQSTISKSAWVGFTGCLIYCPQDAHEPEHGSAGVRGCWSVYVTGCSRGHAGRRHGGKPTLTDGSADEFSSFFSLFSPLKRFRLSYSSYKPAHTVHLGDFGGDWGCVLGYLHPVR